MSPILKMHYWQPYRLAPINIFPPLTSPFKKDGAATEATITNHHQIVLKPAIKARFFITFNYK